MDQIEEAVDQLDWEAHHYGQGFVFPFSIMVGLLAEFSGVVSAITVLGVIGLILTVYFTIRLPEVRQEP